jgi:hypothetical protein
METQKIIDMLIETTTTRDFTTKKYKNLIIFDGNPTHDWVSLFDSYKLKDGTLIRLVQVSWNECELTVYHDSGPMLKVAPIDESEKKVKRPKTMVVKPDFVIIRNQPRGPTPLLDRKNILFGLMMANVPSMNSFMSEYMQMERPIMYGGLKEVEKKLGHEVFPLISISYYSSNDQMILMDQFPSILKISHAHAGMGKMKVRNYEDFRDMSTVIALHGDYCTGEPFIESDKLEYGFRIQKVGDSYRVQKKNMHGSGWKSQFGNSDLVDIELSKTHKLWADECQKLFGGLDWFAIDGLHCKDGSEHILEMNGSAIGFTHWKEDSEKIRDMAVDRMNKLFSK